MYLLIGWLVSYLGTKLVSHSAGVFVSHKVNELNKATETCPVECVKVLNFVYS